MITAAEVWARGLVAAGAAALAATIATAAPTGVGPIDAGQRAVFVFIVVLAASAARPWTLVWLAASVAAVSSSGSAVAAGTLLASAIAMLYVPNAPPAFRGALAAGSSVVFLGLGPLGPDGMSAAAIAIGVAPVLVSGWQECGERAWRVARRVARLSAVFGGALLVLFAGVMLLAWRAGATASGEVDAWVVSSRQGDQVGGAAHLRAASAAFVDARNLADAPWTAPLRALPGLGRSLQALGTVSASGVELTRDAITATETANIADLPISHGRLDLDAIARARDPLAALLATSRRSSGAIAGIDRTWLVPPLRDRLDDFRRSIDESAQDVDLALAAVDAAPGLLGAERARRYLVVFAMPSEARELGGAMVAFGELTVIDGEVQLTRTGSAAALNAGLDEAAVVARNRVVTDPPRPPELAPDLDAATNPERYVRYDPGRFWNNITGTPDLPTVAAAAAALYPQSGGATLDGVLYVDPYALAALLRFSGPIDVVGISGQLTPDNAADFLLRTQYVEHSTLSSRADLFEEVARSAFEQILAGDISGPRVLADALSPLAERRHLLFWSLHPAEQDLLRRAGVDGSLPRGTPDFLAVTQANDNPSKADGFLRRDVRYDATFDRATGAVEATVTVTVSNELPVGTALDRIPNIVSANGHGLPDGTNRAYLSVYTPLSAKRLMVGGFVVPMESHVEQGLHRFGQYVEVPPGTSVDVVMELSGSLDLSGGYGISVWSPPLATPDRVTVHAVPTGPVRGTPVDLTLDASGVARRTP